MHPPPLLACAALQNFPYKMTEKIARILSASQSELQELVPHAVKSCSSSTSTQAEVQEDWAAKFERDIDIENCFEVVDDETFVGQTLIEMMNQLKNEVGDNTFRYVQKIHRGFGHPSSETLVKTLQNAKASDHVIYCAKHYKCAACEHRKPPPTAPKASVISATHFNDKLVIDVFLDSS